MKCQRPGLFLPAKIVHVCDSSFLYKGSHDPHRATICLPGAGGLIGIAARYGYSSLEDVLTLISGLCTQLFSSSLFTYTLRELWYNKRKRHFLCCKDILTHKRKPLVCLLKQCSNREHVYFPHFCNMKYSGHLLPDQ